MLAAAVVLTAFVAVWARLPQDRVRGGDFLASYAAAELVAAGHGDQVYDQAAIHAREQALLPPSIHADLPFLSPPPTLLLLRPVLWLGPDLAPRTWSLAQIGMLLAATWLVVQPRRRRDRAAAGLAMAVAVASVPVLLHLLLAQQDGLAALAVALWWHWRDRRPATAGAALGLGAALSKPHLLVGVAAFAALAALRRRAWRELGAAAIAVAITTGVSLTLTGPRGPVGFAASLAYASRHSPLAAMVGLPGWLGSLCGDSGVVRIAGWVVAMGLVTAAAAAGWAAGARRPGGVGMVILVVLSLLASPHLLPHDLCLLVPWVAAAIATAPDRDPGWLARWWPVPIAWLALSGTALIDTGATSVGPPGRLTPIAAAALATAVALCGGRLLAPYTSGHGSVPGFDRVLPSGDDRPHVG